MTLNFPDKVAKEYLTTGRLKNLSTVSKSPNKTKDKERRKSKEERLRIAIITLKQMKKMQKIN